MNRISFKFPKCINPFQKISTLKNETGNFRENDVWII
jgi:hypothetical protein